MSCSNDMPPYVPRECGEIRPMAIEERRQLLERQKWISNVMRILNMSQADAESVWLKIQLSKNTDATRDDDPPLHWAIQLRRLLLIGYSEGTTREELIERIGKHNAFLRDVTAAIEDSQFDPGLNKVRRIISEHFNKHIVTRSE